MADEKHTHQSLSDVLAALGPGGRATVSFDEYTGLFGHEPTEDELEGERAHRFAKSNDCKQVIDRTAKQVAFMKDASAPAGSRRQSDPSPTQR
jgi:hypothetical protein